MSQVPRVTIARCGNINSTHSGHNDDAKIAALLQSGACTSKAARTLNVSAENGTLKDALKRVLDTKSTGAIKKYIALGANKKQKRR
jgi:transcriptional regulator of acetoin/glycerol metabolism